MLLEIVDVDLTFDFQILHAINFKVSENEIVGIVGRSGVGKTSLLKICAGLLDPSKGQVLFQGQKIEGPAYKLVPGHEDIQLVNQDFALDQYHTVEENIREKILYLPIAVREELITELLDLVELTNYRKNKVYEISGGEQQRLSLARALACEPKVLLLDEPFAHLDFRLKQKIMTYLLKLKQKRKMGIIFVSHDGMEMLSFADKIIRIDQGKIKRIDSPYNFYYFPKNQKEGALFGPFNKVKIKNKYFLFRPNEFALQISEETKICVTFKLAQFSGPYFVNHFVTENKEKIQIYHTEILNEVKKISVKKRDKAFIMG